MASSVFEHLLSLVRDTYNNRDYPRLTLLTGEKQAENGPFGACWAGLYDHCQADLRLFARPTLTTASA